MAARARTPEQAQRLTIAARMAESGNIAAAGMVAFGQNPRNDILNDLLEDVENAKTESQRAQAVKRLNNYNATKSGKEIEVMPDGRLVTKDLTQQRQIESQLLKPSVDMVASSQSLIKEVHAAREIIRRAPEAVGKPGQFRAIFSGAADAVTQLLPESALGNQIRARIEKGKAGDALELESIIAVIGSLKAKQIAGPGAMTDTDLKKGDEIVRGFGITSPATALRALDNIERTARRDYDLAIQRISRHHDTSGPEWQLPPLPEGFSGDGPRTSETAAPAAPTLRPPTGVRVPSPQPPAAQEGSPAAAGGPPDIGTMSTSDILKEMESLLSQGAK